MPWWIVYLSIISTIRNHMSRSHPSHPNTHIRTHKFAVPSVQPTYFLFHLRPSHPWTLLHTRHDLSSLTSPLFTPTHRRAGSLVRLPTSLKPYQGKHACYVGFWFYYYLTSILQDAAVKVTSSKKVDVLQETLFIMMFLSIFIKIRESLCRLINSSWSVCK